MPVGLLALGRDQQIERRRAGRGFRDVVNLAVGDRDDSPKPRARNIGERAVDRREQPRPGIPTLGDGNGA
jgi:hypothetical protein